MSAKKGNNRDSGKEHIYRGNEGITSYATGDACMKECLELIADILRNEGYIGKEQPFVKEKALNLDKVEILYRKARREKTVDFVVCLEKNWLLLVEAKFDVDKVDNIADDIKDKIRHSKEILQSNVNFVHCEGKTIVLLKNDHFHERSNRLKKRLNANPDISPARVCDFYKNYFVAN